MIEFSEELARREREFWSEGLEARVDVSLPPSFVTHKVVKRLRQAGFKVISIPKLELPTIRLSQNTGAYLEELEGKYPGWKTWENPAYDTLDPQKTWWNLKHPYWDAVIKGYTRFPKTGLWMAVEDIEKPKPGSDYTDTEFGKRLKAIGCISRFNLSTHDIGYAVERAYSGFPEEIGVNARNMAVRLPEVFEWNLLGNRYGWGSTNTCEWTQTYFSFVEQGSSTCIYITGHNLQGGTSQVDCTSALNNAPMRGFRVAIELQEG